MPPGGFTLLELLLVLLVLGTLSASTFALVEAASVRAARLQAAGELATLAAALEAYRRHHGDYPIATGPESFAALLRGRSDGAGRPRTGPDFLSGSRWSAPSTSVDAAVVLRDPWEQPYRYHYDPSRNVEYSLWSAGPDGRSRDDPDAPDGDRAWDRDNVRALRR